MLLLMAKMVKLSWFDPDDGGPNRNQPMIRRAVVEIQEVFAQAKSFEHKLVCMQALDQLILEMTYVAKTLTPAVNRRVSISFRDIELKNIFELNLRYLTSLTENLVQNST